jgi:hypothetical protein
MKTIKVTDETYDFLMDLSNELNLQNNRATSTPYFFQIQDKEDRVVPDGYGETVWVCDDIVLKTENDIKEVVFEWKEWDIKNKKHNNLYKKLTESDIEDILSKNYKAFSITTENVYHNAFLTEKSCKKHIERNKHHYNQPVDYLTHAFRNPELEKLIKFLCQLTK